jgi:hypothetical protein
MADTQLGKQEFKGEPKKLPDSVDKKDVSFESVAPLRQTIKNGSDSYSNIPGDGIVPG